MGFLPAIFFFKYNVIFGSPTRSLALEDDDEDDDLFSNPERDFRDDFILDWARVNFLFVSGFLTYHWYSWIPI